MKKTYLAFTIATLFTIVSSIDTAGATTFRNDRQNIVVQSVPNAVLSAYTQYVTDIINSNFPDNSGWEDGEVTWTKNRNVWTATGKVRRVNGGGGPYVLIQSARFTSNGNLIEFIYTVVIPV